MGPPLYGQICCLQISSCSWLRSQAILLRACSAQELPKVELTNLLPHQPIIYTPHLLQIKATVQVNGTSKRLKQIAQYFRHLHCLCYANVALLQQDQNLHRQFAKLVNVVLAFPCRWSNLQLASQHYMDSQCNILSTTATTHHMSHAYKIYRSSATQKYCFSNLTLNTLFTAELLPERTSLLFDEVPPVNYSIFN